MNNELYHHGVLGQKWGVMNGPPYPLDRSVLTGKRLKLTNSGEQATRQMTRDIQRANSDRRFHTTAGKAGMVAGFLTLDPLTAVIWRGIVRGISENANVEYKEAKEKVKTYKEAKKSVRKLIAHGGAATYGQMNKSDELIANRAQEALNKINKELAGSNKYQRMEGYTDKKGQKVDYNKIRKEADDALSDIEKIYDKEK